MSFETSSIYQDSVIGKIKNERDAQFLKWGEQTHDPMTWLAILGEEVGEANQAALHDKFGGSHKGTFKKELIQIAAVAVQILEQIERGKL